MSLNLRLACLSVVLAASPAFAAAATRLPNPAEISLYHPPASFQNPSPTTKDDKSQWRQLKRGMGKDDVRKLLGEPGKVSVGKYFEFWYYAGGNITFDSKSRLDSWDEP